MTKSKYIFVLVLFLLMGSCRLFRKDNNSYVKRNKMAIQGIDISHHQGFIDWEAVKTEKLYFVFMKATEGKTFVDPQFTNYLKQAAFTGHKVGAYHFFNFCSGGTEQADNFITAVPKDQNILPILDLEFDSESECGKTKKEIVKQVNAFIDKIKEQYGRTPVLYMPIAFYKRYGIAEFGNCKLWIRDTDDKPMLPDKKEWHFWQYADRGKINGIDGYVDLNAFNGDEKAFKTFME